MELQTILAILAIIATLVAPLITMMPTLGSRHDKLNKLLDALGKPGMYTVSAGLIQDEIVTQATVLRIQSIFAAQRIALRHLQFNSSMAAVLAIIYNTAFHDRPYSPAVQWILLGISAALLLVIRIKARTLGQDQQGYALSVRKNVEESLKLGESKGDNGEVPKFEVSIKGPGATGRLVAGVFNSIGEAERFVVEETDESQEPSIRRM